MNTIDEIHVIHYVSDHHLEARVYLRRALCRQHATYAGPSHRHQPYDARGIGFIRDGAMVHGGSENGAMPNAQ